ncbi:MAG: methyl-accepting chemotaxis protein, partial [Thermodesulfobacteriota bacterium]
VVADEVRNLAMRAADAAKNTSDLIEGTVKKVKDGASIVKTTNEAFSEVSTNASKVGELVGEIAAASNEQASGIDQVNRAAAEMDKVIQRTAANAEESSSASEQMNAQAEQMKAVVDELVAIVGTDEGQKAGRKHKTDTIQAKANEDSEGITYSRSDLMKKTPEKRAITQAKPPAKPSEIIPLEQEFKDF